MSTEIARLLNQDHHERAPHVQEVLAGDIYAFILRDCLSLSKEDAKAVEKAFSFPSNHLDALGYASAPQPTRLQIPQIGGRDATPEELEEYRPAQHRWLDSLSDDQFLDWFTYTKEPLVSRYDGLRVRVEEVNIAHAMIEAAVAEKYGPVDRIPGLYFEDDRLQLKTFPPRSLIVPCRVRFIIRGLQIYRRAGWREFFWYSSSRAAGGASAVASIHIANEPQGVRDRIALLCPDTITADAESWATGSCAVGVNGLSPHRVVRELREALPELKACAVAASLGERMQRALLENGFTVEVIEEAAADE